MFEEVLEDLKRLHTADQEAQREERVRFQEIRPARRASTTLFVDGGNAPLFNSAALRVEYVRVCALTYKGKRDRTRREEGVLLLRTTVHDGKEYITVKSYPPLQLQLSVPLTSKELSFGRERVSLATVANLARFLIECSFLQRLGQEADLLVRDGSLTPKNSYEERALHNLARKSKKQVLVGLSKTNTLLKEGRSRSATLLARGPRHAWIAYDRKEEDVHIFLTKLHARSEYAFRLDAHGEDDAFFAAEQLARYAHDPLFPGYPYPLIEADKLARVSNKEVAMLRTRFQVEAGVEWHVLERLAKSTDAHDVLNNL